MKTKKSNSNIEVYENLYPFSLSVASINDIEEKIINITSTIIYQIT